jgi:hypothetical protein
VSTPPDGQPAAAPGPAGWAAASGPPGSAWADADSADADPAGTDSVASPTSGSAGSWAAAPAGDETAAGDEAGMDEAGEPVPAELVRLAAAVAALDEIAGLPVAEHVPRYDALHGELSDALASIDEV